MAVRYISKGKGRNRKSFPIRPKKGVSIRSVSLQPSAIKKINKEQGRLLNKGESANFSKALNQVVIRAKRDGIPIYDTHVNSNDRRKPYHMWIVKHPEKGDKIKGSDTIVMAEDYGQAIDDMITIWNKEKRKNTTIGYPQVQGTAEKSFRFKKDGVRLKRYNVCDPFLEDPASHKPDDTKHTNQIMYSLGDESCASVLTDEEFSMLLTDNQVANTFSPIGDTATKWQQDEEFRKRILDRALELIEEAKRN